jgi:hypothetical protein
MPDILKKFVEAAQKVSSDTHSMRECVYGAYLDHLSGIHADDLPDEIQVIFESVEMKLKSVAPAGDIGDDEAGYLAKDILYMADVVRSHYKP